MLGLGLGVDKSRGGFGKFQYLSGLPSFVPSAYSLAFDASGAETLADYEAGTLYFRDSNFDRVGATFSRTTTATRVNKQGLIESVAANVPRIDYTDGSAKLLMEPSRTNLALSSEDFTSVYWSNINATLNADQTTAPDGTTTADKMAGNGTSTFVILRRQSVTLTAVDYTLSFFAKADTYDIVSVGAVGYTSATGSTRAYADLTNGTVSGGTIKDYGNGWYRISITFKPDAGDLVGDIQFTLAKDLSNVPFDSNADTSGKSVFVWGAQLEVGSYPTSYIPTAGSTVTRNADSCELTGASSYIGQTKGVLYSDFKLTNTVLKAIHSIDDGTTANFIAATLISNQSPRVTVRDSFGAINTLITGTALSLGDHKFAVKYEASDYEIYIDGASDGTSSSSLYPTGTLSRYVINNSSYGYMSDGYKSLILFPTDLTASELQQLTS